MLGARAQVRDICAILSGLVVAQDYRRGQQLVVNRNFADNAEFFQVRACAPEQTRRECRKGYLHAQQGTAGRVDFACCSPGQSYPGLKVSGAPILVRALGRPCQ